MLSTSTVDYEIFDISSDYGDKIKMTTIIT